MFVIIYAPEVLKEWLLFDKNDKNSNLKMNEFLDNKLSNSLINLDLFFISLE